MNNQEEKKESPTPIYTTIKNSKGGDIPVTIYDKSNEPAECPPSVAKQIQKRIKRAEFWGISLERIGELNYLAEYAVRQSVVSGGFSWKKSYPFMRSSYCITVTSPR